MENASKALLIAGAVMIGILTVSLAVYIYSSYQTSSSAILKIFENQKVNQFNAPYFKYETTTLNAHDVVTIVNMAKSNNNKYDVEQETKAVDSSRYIQVVFNGNANLEKLSEDELIEFIKNNSYEINSSNLNIVNITYEAHISSYNSLGYVNKIQITKK